MALTARPLTDEDIRAIREMPEFQKQLKKIMKLKRKADKAREAERKAKEPCPGAAPIAEGLILRCPKCGLELVHNNTTDNLYKNHLILMRDRHWNRPDRPDANPFTSSGLSGKAAAAADGDWYGSH